MAQKKMNVKLLRRIQKHITVEPRRYWQNDWLNTNAAMQASRTGTAPPCGTQGCIAGWACVLGQPKVPISKLLLEADQTVSPEDTGHIVKRARRLLAITQEQAERLFSPAESTWPRKFSTAYYAAKTARGRASAAVRRIDHFIATNGAD